MTWAQVYEADWRAAHTALGTIDLDPPGTTFTYDGVTWTTPAVADGNPVDQRTSVLWELGATGLHCQSPNNSRFVNTNNNAPHIYTTLPELAANTATPFDADPTRSLLLQAYVSDATVPRVVDAGAMVAIYKLDFGVVLGNANEAASAFGTDTGGTEVNWATSGVGASPPGIERTDLSLNVPTIRWNNGSRIDFFVAPFDILGDTWPDNALLQKIAGYRPDGELNNDVVCDPPTYRIAAAVNNMPSPTPNAYDSTFQRFRVLQEQ